MGSLILGSNVRNSRFISFVVGNVSKASNARPPNFRNFNRVYSSRRKGVSEKVSLLYRWSVCWSLVCRKRV